MADIYYSESKGVGWRECMWGKFDVGRCLVGSLVGCLRMGGYLERSFHLIMKRTGRLDSGYI